MTLFDAALSAFHFLRPLVLLGLIPLAAIWWYLRRPIHSAPLSDDTIAPLLKAALSIDRRSNIRSGKRLQPVDLATLRLALILLAASGPTWSRIKDPFAAQTAPMVVVLKVTLSMLEPDLAPTRLERAKHKIRDLLDLRAGARTALIAFAGSAHPVVPMTEDSAVMQPYLEGLDPAIMPVDGSAPQAALTLAQQTLSRETTPGGVLFILDELSTADATQLMAAAQDTPLAFLVALPDGQSLPALSGIDARTISMTADASDLRKLERGFQAAYQQAQLQDGAQPWQDRGPYLAWPAALLLLLWFRRGMTLRLVLLMALCLTCPAKQAQAQEQAQEQGLAQTNGLRLVNWFFTPDQQGWRAFRNKDYAVAADRFADPYLRGVAQYRGGQYEDAARTFAGIDTADAAFAQGLAHIKSRSYRDGVHAFERALALDPDHPGARANLPVAKQIVTYIEETREQSDSGEDTGIGADDVVYDNDTARGAETEIQPEATEGTGLLTTEQWMNTVDTRTGDFLKQRFQLEAAGGTP